MLPGLTNLHHAAHYSGSWTLSRAALTAAATTRPRETTTSQSAATPASNQLPALHTHVRKHHASHPRAKKTLKCNVRSHFKGVLQLPRSVRYSPETRSLALFPIEEIKTLRSKQVRAQVSVRGVRSFYKPSEAMHLCSL